MPQPSPQVQTPSLQVDIDDPGIDFSSTLECDSAGDISLQLRADMKQCFEQLSTNLLAEIRAVLSEHTRAVLAEHTSREANMASRPVYNASCSGSRVELPQKKTFVNEEANEFIEMTPADRSDTWKPILDDPDAALRKSKDCGFHHLASVNSKASDEQQAFGSQKLQAEMDMLMTPAQSCMLDDTLHKYSRQEAIQKRCLYRFVSSPAFTMFSMLIVILNACWMGYEVGYIDKAGALTGRDLDWYEVVNVAFTVWFFLELCLRIAAEKNDFITGPDCVWNILDLILVIINVPDLFMKQMDVTAFRIFRLVRLAKVLRIVRLLRFFQELHEILVTVAYTFVSLCWSLVAILIVAYVFALLIENSIKQSQAQGVQFSRVHKDFETLFRSMLALFTCITGGQDWYEIMEDFINHGDYVSQVALLCWIFFMMFGFVNVVVAIFCARIAEASQEHYRLRIFKQQEAHNRKIKDLTSIFQKIDTRRTGLIEWRQFRDFAEIPENYAMLQFHGLQLHALRTFWNMMSDNEYLSANVSSKIGFVDVTNFVAGFLRLSADCTQTDILLIQLSVRRMRASIHEHFQEQQFAINDLHRSLNIHGHREASRPSHVRIQSTPWAIKGVANSVRPAEPIREVEM